jgi:beta-glucosidase
VYVDGKLTVDQAGESEHADLGAAVLAPPAAAADISLTAGTPVELRLEFDLAGRTGPMAELLGLRFGTEPAAVDSGALIAAAAAEAAAGADVALVVVGTNSAVESEGYDRASLALPGRQDDLIRAVAAVNPRTVVLVNAGSPVLMPWRHQVAAVRSRTGRAAAHHLAGSRGRRAGPVNRASPPGTVTDILGSERHAPGEKISLRAWDVRVFRSDEAHDMDPAQGRGA